LNFIKRAPRKCTKIAHQNPEQCVLLDELFDRGFKRREGEGNALPEDYRFSSNQRQRGLVEKILVWVQDEDLLAWVETVFAIFGGAP
jgi:hypothetical protein